MEIELKDKKLISRKTYIDVTFICPEGCSVAPTKPTVIEQTAYSIKLLLPYPSRKKRYAKIMKKIGVYTYLLDNDHESTIIF